MALDTDCLLNRWQAWVRHNIGSQLYGQLVPVMTLMEMVWTEKKES